MAKKKTELVPYTEASSSQVLPGLDLRAMRRSVLVEGGLLSPRQRYATKEERKTAAKGRAKERREARKTFLEEKGISPMTRKPRLTRPEKKVRSKALRRMRNVYLREHPSEAKALGIDLGRLRV